MKKVILVLIVFLLCACDKGEVFKCQINNKDAVFTFKNGIVTSYTLDRKKQSKEVVDEINGLHLTSAKNNSEGKELLREYVVSINGTCEEN